MKQLWLSSQALHRAEELHFKTQVLLKLENAPRVGASLL